MLKRIFVILNSIGNLDEMFIPINFLIRHRFGEEYRSEAGANFKLTFVRIESGNVTTRANERGYLNVPYASLTLKDATARLSAASGFSNFG